jgi:GntR family transcriptional regulator
MNFHIDKDSSIPVHAQIKERIKIALSLGELRQGDTLPSIRDLEAELGVGRAIVWRAYLDLQQQGLLEMQRGRRVTVSDATSIRPQNGKLLGKLESLILQTLDKATALGVNEVSFARYLLSRALEPDRARHRMLYVDNSKELAEQMGAELAKQWGMPITAVQLCELPSFFEKHGARVTHVIASYYRLESVRAAVGELSSKQVKHLSMRLVFSEQTRNRMRSLPAGSQVLLLSAPDDFEREGQAFAAFYQDSFSEMQLRFIVKPFTSEAAAVRLGKSMKYQLIVVASVVWEKLSIEIKALPGFIRPIFELDNSSVEQGRIEAGILQ